MYLFKRLSNPKINSPILIEGLPGMGNVGKIAVDFIIDNLQAQKVYDIFSSSFPHAVFINEDNLVELPKIEVYYKKIKSKDYLFVAGDIQPIDETSCYTFCEDILNIFKKNKIKEIITIGGIGLQHIPENPKVYITANEKNIINKYRHKNVTNKIYGFVGPIIGVSGLLLGIAKQKNIPAIALLAETFGHPNYIGIKGSREVLEILNKKLNFNLDLKKLDKEIKEIEKEIQMKSKQLEFLQKTGIKGKEDRHTNYIG